MGEGTKEGEVVLNRDMATIRVKFTVPGFHCWPDAPDRRAYLRNPHRHLFHVTVATLVSHDDREIEFHDLIDEAKGMFTITEGSSCEMAARFLAKNLSAAHGRSFTVIVSEDGECEAEVTVAA